MIGIAPQEWKTDLPEFCEKTRDFYAGKMDKGSYKGFSGRYGSYAQKGGTASMLRLRMTAGCVSKEKLAFIAKAIRAYQVNMVHFTTCESVQFHNLDEKSVCELMEQALDAGIVTMGGGGDFPRNVMCSPLSGVEEGEYFDVMPWAKAAGEYLMTFINAEKMPRKLKVCFSNSPANVTHATYRDLGFAACPDGTFDVYSAGGLGNNPQFGVKVAGCGFLSDIGQPFFGECLGVSHVFFVFSGSSLKLSGCLGTGGGEALFGVCPDSGQFACGLGLGGSQFFSGFFAGQGAALDSFLTQQLDLGLE